MEDRRSLDRRVTSLEQIYARVEAEQKSLREMMDLRFQTIDKGQEILLVEFRSFKETVQRGIDDPHASPMGRALLAELEKVRQDVADLQTKHSAHHQRFASMQGVIDRFKGSIQLASAMGLGGLLLSLGLALAKWILLLPMR
jgi:hypothetical protein